MTPAEHEATIQALFHAEAAEHFQAGKSHVCQRRRVHAFDDHTDHFTAGLQGTFCQRAHHPGSASAEDHTDILLGQSLAHEAGRGFEVRMHAVG